MGTFLSKILMNEQDLGNLVLKKGRSEGRPFLFDSLGQIAYI